MAAFAKYDGIDGEAIDANHDKWIDVLSLDWGAHKPGGGATGQSRRRGAAVVEDITLTIEYEKAAPKLQEKCLMGEVIPKIRAAGKNCGAGGNSPADAAGVAEFINLGANFITVSSQGLLRLAGQDFRKRVEEAL